MGGQHPKTCNLDFYLFHMEYYLSLKRKLFILQANYIRNVWSHRKEMLTIQLKHPWRKLGILQELHRFFGLLLENCFLLLFCGRFASRFGIDGPIYKDGIGTST